MWSCFFIIIFGLPGNWLMALPSIWLVFLGEYLSLAVLLAFAIAAEVLETWLGSRLAKQAGASKAGGWGAFLGAFLGGLFLTFLLPIPVLGTLFGVCAGAFLGVVLFEQLWGNSSTDLLNIGKFAALGALLGRMAKVIFGAAAAVFWSIYSFNRIPGFFD